MEIVVFGAGSLGTLLGGLLATEHQVTLVGRDPHVSAVRDDGLYIDGEFDRRVHPDARTDGRDLTADLVVVAVKSFDTEQAAGTLSSGTFDAALSVQNGIGNEAVLEEYLDCPVLAGTATYGARLEAPGRVACTGTGTVTVGAAAGGASPLADDVAVAFDTADIDATAVADMPRRLWQKLAVNAGINPITALSRVQNGVLSGGSTNRLARRAATETARVARAEAIELADERAVDAIEKVIDGTASNRSSMYQDVLAGRRTEIDAINGAVVDRADEHGVDVPVNETLATLVRSWERENGGR